MSDFMRDRERLDGVLRNLSAFLGLPILVVDADGLRRSGYGAISEVKSGGGDALFYADVIRRAQAIKSPLLFTTADSFSYMAFPLIDQKCLSGGVIVGPFQIEKRSNCRSCCAVTPSNRQEDVPIMEDAQAEHLKRLIEQLVAPRLPTEMSLHRPTKEGAIQQAMLFVAENYQEKLTVEDVARQIGLSYSYFSKLFCDAVGVGFREYLLQFRIEKSKELLSDSEDRSLADIALAVGFPNQSYYCRAFKKIVGTTPGKFRAARTSQC